MKKIWEKHNNDGYKKNKYEYIKLSLTVNGQLWFTFDTSLSIFMAIVV